MAKPARGKRAAPNRATAPKIDMKGMAAKAEIVPDDGDYLVEIDHAEIAGKRVTGSINVGFGFRVVEADDESSIGRTLKTLGLCIYYPGDEDARYITENIALLVAIIEAAGVAVPDNLTQKALDALKGCQVVLSIVGLQDARKRPYVAVNAAYAPFKQEE